MTHSAPRPPSLLMNDRPLMKNIYFASDMHLGAPYIADHRQHEARVVAWLDSIKDKAQALYLLGDIFDYWFEYRTVVPRGHVRFLAKVAELTDRGVDVHFFTGNHDVWMFDYLPAELGVTVHHGDLRGVRLMRLVQRASLRVQVVEAHGDAGALEGEGNLVGDQGLAHAALLIAYQNRLHIITSLCI